MSEHGQRLDELVQREGGRVDATEREIFSFENRPLETLTTAHVASFGSEEEVQNELASIDLTRSKYQHMFLFTR